MEKDALGAPRPAACYRAYEGLKSANNGNTSSLKRPPAHSIAAAGMAGMEHGGSGGTGPGQPDGHLKSDGKGSSQARCLCFGGVPDKSSRHSFLKGFLINLAICAVLVLYTLLGSFIFLYIEGSAAEPPLQQRSLATTIPAGPAYSSARRNASWINQINEARVRTVESLWLTTERLNILYRDNWTRLATEEIIRFQEQVVRTLTDNLGAAAHSSVTHSLNDDVTGRKIVNYEWNFARAFLYSLTVLTTIGYGSIAPRSALGKLVTMGYAFVGIPLTLVYLSSAGGLLSRCARGVFTRALCCCLCSNCGYCCYDERRMQEKERRMRKRRQQEELAQQQQQQQQQMQLQEPFYVRANASAYPGALEAKCSPKDEVSSLGSGDRTSVTILAPISICLGAMLCYIVAGAFALHKLEGWDLTDASYFCFMSLSTIGFGDIVPGSYPGLGAHEARDATVWFCSCYIMSGMALTAMCFNILHDEIVHRLAHQADGQRAAQQAAELGLGRGPQQRHHHQHGQLLKPSASLDELAAPACREPFAVAS
ncbi:TWiK family of potassium channels protein 9-like isoform X2 [Phymastichus coffea]|uniref:TWiK family of potassium channels protein 9-like isoform X2 n=1 Tax=Phymastichus coffea TaxID=108790 RepID=UPI00273BFC63|nr:TWiK family of potassium channels protein 9-like isoform X2 [Phymastichus coffea]